MARREAVSSTATESYTTSGSTLSETLSCPSQGTAQVGPYNATADQLSIGGAVTVTAADGGPCTAYDIRLYTRLPIDAGVIGDAGVILDAGG